MKLRTTEPEDSEYSFFAIGRHLSRRTNDRLITLISFLSQFRPPISFCMLPIFVVLQAVVANVDGWQDDFDAFVLEFGRH